jgi:gamma-glutamylcyclotransferase (GGCT)/AIG2-like uncharacterized protein YtfP
MPGQLLFAYGTLQQPEVQLANFGRLLEGVPDTAIGYALGTVAIDDPDVAALSGLAVHTIIAATGDPADIVPGTVFRLTAAELAAADAYETSAYVRAKVALASGRHAWAYIKGH